MSVKQFRIMLFISTLVLASFVYGQAPADPRLTQALELEATSNFEEAMVLYEAIYVDQPQNNAMAYKIAGMAYGIKNYKKAVIYYQILAPKGNPSVLYNLACSLNMMGKKKQSLDALETAVEKGFTQLTLMKSDPDLASIRELKRFHAIAKSVKALENYPEAQKFNFWVGEWNVYNQQDVKVGESRIEKILKDGVILESWTGGSGNTGKSFNHFHIGTGKWVQYWVDQSSDRIFLEGNYDPTQKAIVFYERIDQGSEKPQRRLTFFNISPDSVRQYSQQSTDGGTTWFIEYNFIYLRKK